MRTLSEAQKTTIAQVFNSVSPKVKQRREGHWDVDLCDGAALTVSARAEDDWLHLEAPLAVDTTGEVVWSLVRMNAQLEAVSKLALPPDQQVIRLRAEIPLGDQVDLAERLRVACTGFKTAWRSFQPEGKFEPALSQSPVGSPQPLSSASSDLARLCAEAGWALSERSSGKLAVDVDGQAGFYQIVMEPAQGVHLWVQLAQFQALSQTSQHALGLLLLTACGVVRFARAAVEENDGSVAVRFEVKLASALTPAELDHALASLSIARQLCGREVKALEDEMFASDYLTVRGWSW